MTQPENNKTTAVWKLVLIPILLIGLIWNVSRGAGEAAAAVADTIPVENDSSTAEPVVVVTDVLEEIQQTQQDEASRPTLQPEWELEHDPFALVGQLAEQSGITRITETAPVAASSPADLAEDVVTTRVLTSSVRAVLNGPFGPVALVDSRIVRVGDFLEPDVRIVAIESDGIVVELTDQTGKAM